MTISGSFIRRPVATFLLMGALVVFGVMGYRLLPVNNLPTVDFPTIQVAASLPGASAETMASAVATPLERQFSTIAGLDSMTSSSTLGLTQVTLQFSLSRDIDAAAQDVQASLSRAQPLMPPELLPPSYQKVNPADQPIIYFALRSDTLSLSEVDKYAETLIAPNISILPGVAAVQVLGAQKYAVRIQLDPRTLAARGIGIDQVVAAVRGANSNLPTGALWGRDRTTSVETDAELRNAASFRPTIVAYQNGEIVRLQDLGSVVDGVQNDKIAAWNRLTRTILIAVQRQPGSNTVAVADAVRTRVESLKARLPASVETLMIFDRSESIRDSVRDVKLTLLLTLFLVVGIIFVFLRNVTATIVPSLALPLSIMGTFGLMYLLGYTLDNLSLIALTLALGFVVDDAVVMLENIMRHLEMGKPRMQAANEGSKEIETTIVSMTVSLVAVFIPLLFMGGLIGRLFQEFAVTISVAVLLSGVISLTLSPMLCSQMLSPPNQTHHGRVWAVTEAGWNAMLHFYERTLAFVLRHRPFAVVFSLAVLGGAITLFNIIPKGFLPSEDIGMVFGVTEGPQGASFEWMARHQRMVAEILNQDPNVETFNSSIGPGGPTSLSNQGRVFLHLKPLSQRRLSADQVIQELRPKLARIPGLKVYLQNPPSIRIGGQFTQALYQYTLQSTETSDLYAAVPRLTDELRRIDGLQDIASDLMLQNPQVTVKIDRDKAAALGVTPAQVEDALYYAYSARQVSTINTPIDQYWVIMEVAPEFQRDPSTLNLLYIRAASGDLVQLSTLATMTPSVGPLAINHNGQIPSATISFNLKPGYALSQAVTDVEAAARRVLPDSVTTSFAGTAQAFRGSQGNLGMLLLLAVMVIYLVLGILYESFIHPLTILTGLPFAGFGALLTLWLFHVDLDIYGFVGLVMLIGVVKKNAIMMIDFAVVAQRHGAANPATAIYEAARIRFRPIMMTTMAALMGTLPIALGLGAGGETRQPLGLAVVGGLAFSQFVTLYVTPVFYTYFDRLEQRAGGRLRQRAAR